MTQRAIDLGPIRRQTEEVNPGAEGWVPQVRGPECYCPIVILCDAPTSQAYEEGLPLHWPHHKFLARAVKKHGFGLGDIKLVGLCPPIPRQDIKSASRKWTHVKQYLPQVQVAVDALNPRIIVTFGELATRALYGRPIKITKVRGVPVLRDDAPPILPMLSPGFVNRIPDHIPTFDADVATLARIKEANYDAAQFTPQTGSYEWVEDLEEYFRLHDGFESALSTLPRVMAVDTEGTGLRWWDPEVELLSVQICWEPGRALVVPVCDDWHGHPENAGDYSANRRKLKEILEDPNVRKVGHNIKFEHMHLRKLGIEIQGWLHDTQLMLFNVDENLMDKRLGTGTKLFVPEMAGYSDEFDQTYDKSNMAAVPREDFVTYGGGDADATFRLARRLKPMLDADARQRNCYRRIQMQSIMSFAKTVEPHGMLVDQQKLAEFGTTLDEWLDEAYRSLIARTPAAVKQDHLDRGKELKFSRADFIRDILFSQQGFNLTPRTFTDSTADLPPAQRLASTSSKKHLPYFTTVRTPVGGGQEGTVGTYVKDLMAFQKAQKLNTTYVGKQETSNGLWQYLSPEGRIHPSYMLHRTNTGRTASADPNGQNFPTRGDWAKSYKEVFEASPGFTLVSCDLSQIELRLVAWTAMDPTMLQIYRDGGDIHAMTAASTMGLTLQQFMALPEAERKQRRFNAKAINFGFIYGMSAGGFQVYAKTEYDIDYTDEQCFEIRNNFFQTYWSLPVWHNTMHRFVDEHGYVRSLHGAVRHLPSIYSEDQSIRAATRRYAVNSPIQRFGSDLGLIGLNRFCHQADPRVMRMNGFVHDALYMEVREDYAEEAVAALKWTMETPPLKEWFNIEPPLPIVADAEIDGEERPDLEAWKPDWWNDDEEAVARHYIHTHALVA